MSTNNPIVQRDKLFIRSKVSIQSLLKMDDFLDYKSNLINDAAIFDKINTILKFILKNYKKTTITNELAVLDSCSL